MASRTDTLVKGMTGPKQAEAKQAISEMNIDLSDVFKNLDLDKFTKSIIGVAIDFAQENFLPKLAAKSPKLAVFAAMLLDALESAVK